MIQSRNFEPGISGWQLNDSGPSYFNAPSIARSIVVEAGAITVPNLTTPVTEGFGTLAEWYAETTIAADPVKTYRAVAEIGNEASVSAHSSDPSRAYFGLTANILFLMRKSGSLSLCLRIELQGQGIFALTALDQETFDINWKVYEEIQ